ncbi:hypothetical protein evm_012190 [Chilo suppressalis]|nr:hypothetical protein evm_012190 [Chilo suppressalis]
MVAAYHHQQAEHVYVSPHTGHRPQPQNAATGIFLVVFIHFIWTRHTRVNCTTGTTSKLCFPSSFMFGVATASYQIEGAWNVSGKGENIWDRYTHTRPERIFDHGTGDVAADSYHQFRQDVRLLKELGVRFYRFSMSWSRILPTGLTNEVNPDGIRYYKELIEELHKNGIEPLVTMYHWDLPQPLQDLGGWTNPVIADYFVDYAKVLLDNFGDRVKFWLTFNEPLSFCHDGYGGSDAPGDRATGMEDYLCGHTVLRAHAAVYRMFQRDYNHRITVSAAHRTLPVRPRQLVTSPAASPVSAARTVSQLIEHYLCGLTISDYNRRLTSEYCPYCEQAHRTLPEHPHQSTTVNYTRRLTSECRRYCEPAHEGLSNRETLKKDN